MEQHYRMNLQDAIEKYHAGDITIKGLIHFYILIKCKPGWKIKIDYESIKQLVLISKSSFYHVISCLKQEGLILWEAIKGIRVSIVTPEVTQPDYPVAEPDSRILDCQSEILDCQSEILDCQSEILDYEAPKAATQSDCIDSPSLDQSLDQLLKSSLSTEEEREDFIKFGKKKAASLPKPPSLPLSWIKKHLTELLEQWQKQSGVTTNQANIRWENHPKKEEWLNEIRTIGYAEFLFVRGVYNEERAAFGQWADTSNLIWGTQL